MWHSVGFPPPEDGIEIVRDGDVARISIYHDIKSTPLPFADDIQEWEGEKFDFEAPWEEGLKDSIKANFDTYVKQSVAAAKVEALSLARGAEIEKGVEIETSVGHEHFSLTRDDQMNIQNLSLQAAAGAPHVLYHSNGNLCRLFSAEEILLLAQKAVEHVTYHQTYFNHLKMWVTRAETAEEIRSIEYGSPLPPDLQQSMADLLGIRV